TKPLRDLRPLPDHGEGEVHRERVEPIRPTPPKDTGEASLTRQSTPEPSTTAPTATGLSFEGVGVGLAATPGGQPLGFAPSSNPPDTNGRIGGTQYVQWNNTSFAVFDK